jgi:hypothetical protein
MHLGGRVSNHLEAKRIVGGFGSCVQDEKPKIYRDTPPGMQLRGKMT